MYMYNLMWVPLKFDLLSSQSHSAKQLVPDMDSCLLVIWADQIIYLFLGVDVGENFMLNW